MYNNDLIILCSVKKEKQKKKKAKIQSKLKKQIQSNAVFQKGLDVVPNLVNVFEQVGSKSKFDKLRGTVGKDFILIDANV